MQEVADHHETPTPEHETGTAVIDNLDTTVINGEAPEFSEAELAEIEARLEEFEEELRKMLEALLAEIDSEAIVGTPPVLNDLDEDDATDAAGTIPFEQPTTEDVPEKIAA